MPKATAVDLVHDSVVVEVPEPPKPVTTERTTAALLARPEFAWAVLKELQYSKLLGPWRELGPNPWGPDVTKDLKNVWRRSAADNRHCVDVYLKDEGYDALGYGPVSKGFFAGPQLDAAHALLMIDKILLENGYILT